MITKEFLLLSFFCVAIKVLKPADAKCYIGLSSKTIRMVSADRILKEADAAVEHAQEDAECPIIAFRANAEKYMEFVEKN